MSLVNQMLQDLEQRRSAEAGMSPLGGLSASGEGVSKTVSAAQSINYVLLGATLMMLIVVVLVLVYWFGVSQSAPLKPLLLAQLPSTMQQIPVVKQSMVKQSMAKQEAVEPQVHEPLTKPKQAAVATVVQNKTQNTVQEKKQANTPTNNVVVANIKASVVELKSDQHKMAALAVAAVSETRGDDDAESMPITAVKADMSVEKIITPLPAKFSAVQHSNDADQADREHINKTIRPLTGEQQAQLAFQRAVKLLGRDDQQAAQLALQQSLSFDPTYVRARETLSALLLNTGRVSEAMDRLSEGLRLQPQATPLAKLYARILVGQGDAGIAIGIMERARPAISADPDYYALLAVLYRGAGKNAQAAQVYQQILLVRPGVAAWWLGLGLSQDAMGESDQALDAYGRANRAGGLKPAVLQYVQERIQALTPVISNARTRFVTDDADGFED